MKKVLEQSILSSEITRKKLVDTFLLKTKILINNIR